MRQHHSHVAKVAEGIRKVHQVANVASLSSQRNQALEERCVHRDVRHIHAHAEQYHEGKRRKEAISIACQRKQRDTQSSRGQTKPAKKCAPVIFHQYQRAVGEHHGKRDPGFRLRKTVISK